MGLRLLVLFLIFIPAVSAHGADENSGCLTCHSSHYLVLGTCTQCHGGYGEAKRKKIAHIGLIPSRLIRFTIPGAKEVSRGEKLAEQYACRRCHRIGGRGNGLAADLDRLRLAPTEVVVALKEPALYMPDFALPEQQVTDLTNYIFHVRQRVQKPNSDAEIPLLVHFEETKGDGSFVKRCGPCHKAISGQGGGTGRGDIGPNLSGLFSPFYPASYRDNARWTEKRLETWLKNPRTVRPHARMQPVFLPAEDFQAILAQLQHLQHPNLNHRPLPPPLIGKSEKGPAPK